MNHKRTPLIVRFERKINKSGPVIRGLQPCWLWTAALDGRGYGVISTGGMDGHLERAHRVSYRLYVGPIPDGMLVCHSCDVRSCVRPDHLWLGTQSDNCMDAYRKGRNWSRGVRGSALRRGHITEADIPIIRLRCANGETQQAVADAFGVRQTTISQIVRRKSWAHVP